MKTTPPALLLDRPTVAELLTLDDCIAAVESAFAAHARGETLPSGLLHGDGVGGEFHLKAGGLLKPQPYYACKVNGGFFQNRSRFDLPNIQGLILLYDATNGIPLAVMESATVTILRTGAATAVAAKYLAPPGAETALICGCGFQGAVQLRALSRVLKLRRAFVWCRDTARAMDFAARMSAELGFEVCATSDLLLTGRTSDVIVTCTPARKWFLGRMHVRPGAFVAAVGADSPDKQEIEPALLAESSVITDFTGQAAHVGDLHHAIAAGLMTEEQVRGDLGGVVSGAVLPRRRIDETVVFDSTGTALQDVATAALVYERAVAAKRGVRFPFWG